MVGPDPATRRRLVDALLAVGCAATSIGPGTAAALFPTSPYFGVLPPWWVTAPAALAVGVATWHRRRRPAVAAAAALVVWTLVAAFPPVVVALYTVGAYHRSRRQLTTLAVLATVVVAVPFVRYGFDAVAPLSIALCVAPTLLGLWVGARRGLIANLRERTRQLEHERELVATHARAEERTRIAREMHDVVAHRLSLMVLHATAMESATDPAHSQLAGRIRLIGREALTELRQVVTILRADGDTPLAPQAGLADLDALVDESRGLGLPVTLDRGGTPTRPLPALIDHACYRVVQEALTNVHRHTADAPTSVRVEHGRGEVRVVVENAAAEPSAEGLPGSGTGLIGLRERLVVLGGSLTAGATDTGGFRVAATIPVQVR